MDKPPTRERGTSSSIASTVMPWSSWTGGDDLERVTELQWPNSVLAYRGMMNDAQLYSLMNGLVLPIRAYGWYLEPNGARPEVVDRISRDYNLPVGKENEFNRLRAQRRFSFDKHLEDALRALVYGHMFFEQVGEIGEGQEGLPNDGKWHLRKLAIRPPHTIHEIEVADDGGLKWIKQTTDPTEAPIPVSCLVAYVWDQEGANWVGRSMFRSVYRNHIVKDRVLRVGAINIERAGGIPYVQAPEGASGDQIRDLDALARRFRVGESAGAALPHGAQLKFAAAAGGDGAVAYLKQQNEEMARAFLQMVNMLGQTNSGSRALGSEFRDIAQVAQYTIAKWFRDRFNEYQIEDDVEWNEGPDEDYAPLLAFDAGKTDPIGGFESALDEDDGIQVADPEVRAAFGDESRRRLPAGRRSRQRDSGRVTAAAEASPLPLPARPLRRDPYDHEIQAAVDWQLLDSLYQGTFDQLEQAVRLLRGFQVQDLHDAIVEAQGDLDALSQLRVGGDASEAIQRHLVSAAAAAMDQATAEAAAQGVDVRRQSVEDLMENLSIRAKSVDNLLASEVAQAASREAIRLTGGGLSPGEVAEQVKQFLNGLSGTYAKDVLGGAVHHSVNAGRKLVFQRDEASGTLYASELLDTNTCPKCKAVDGTQYASMLEAERDYPTGHYKDCDGRERCRGTLVKVYASGGASG